jgi:hypothetical protein
MMVYGLTPYVEVAEMKDKMILCNQTIQDKKNPTCRASTLLAVTMALLIDIQGKFTYNQPLVEGQNSRSRF